MQIPPLLEKNKIIISGIIGAIVFIGIGYYLVTMFLNSDINASTVDATKTSGTGLLPKNFMTISDAINKDKLSLKDKTFLDSYFMKHAVDYTTYVSTSTSRGRLNPFVPYYDFTRSSR